ncbi:MAG TPA: hotdog fold domain-containing protein [Gammaproteobacteria bacterium]|nr:hotdog fold domain-containing protein [Gammaproteobacteria bacterium]HRP87499.1 hotdog fold domain-containing protein [Gammaproteobacteria bacterium]
MASEVQAMGLWRRLGGSELGRWLFTRIVCVKAPYFASISPRLTRLEPGRCEAYLKHRRRVQNHIGTVHAIALCNLAELCAGLVTDVSIPRDMRWIPQDMTVRYLKKAAGRISAIATPATELRSTAEPYPATIEVRLSDAAGQLVASADIHMWLSPRPGQQARKA